MNNIIRVALLHYADVHNYGDVLFPMLAEQELKKRIPNIAIDFFNSTGKGPVVSQRYDRAKLDHDAIVIAGGEIIHRLDDMLLWIYRRLGYQSIPQPTDLVFDWTSINGPYKAWLALGMLVPDERSIQSVKKAVPGLNLVGVRDSATATRLLSLGFSSSLSADLGWLFPRLINQTKPPELPKKPYVVVQIIPVHAPRDMASIVAPLKELQQSGLGVVLLPITTCWGDEESLQYLSRLSGFRVLSDRLPAIQKMHIIANSSMSITQSMHGFVTTLAFGKPAGLVWPLLEDKYAGLLGDLGLEHVRVGSWDQLPDLITRLTARTDDIRAIASRCASSADSAFDQLADNIKKHVAQKQRSTAASLSA